MDITLLKPNLRYCYREKNIPKGATSVQQIYGYPAGSTKISSIDTVHNRAFGWSFYAPHNWESPLCDFERARFYDSSPIRGSVYMSCYIELYSDEFTYKEYKDQIKAEKVKRANKHKNNFNKEKALKNYIDLKDKNEKKQNQDKENNIIQNWQSEQLYEIDYYNNNESSSSSSVEENFSWS